MAVQENVSQASEAEREKLRKTSPLRSNQEARGGREKVDTREDGVGPHIDNAKPLS